MGEAPTSNMLLINNTKNIGQHQKNFNVEIIIDAEDGVKPKLT